MKEFQPAEEFQFFLMERAAKRILSVVGTEVSTYAADVPTPQEVMRAVMGIDDSSFLNVALSETVVPKLTIARPINQAADWEYQIDYAAQDADLTRMSRRILIMDDPMIGTHGLVSMCMGNGERDMLSVWGAEGIIEDLEGQLESMGQVVSLAA